MPSLFEDIRQWLLLLCVDILKSGQVPKHVAVIMDGNRRYARKYKMDVVDGHKKGYERLIEVAEWCDLLGVQELTVYAFSIENFNRSSYEVDALMNLIREKCRELLEKKDLSSSEGKGIRFRWIGNLSLLPADLQQLMGRVTEATKDNTRVTINMAFAYTGQEEITQAIRHVVCVDVVPGQEEITQAIRHVVSGVSQGLLTREDISDDLIAACLYTHPSPFPDLLIRTSGETRLSDFLLWQVSASCIHFTEVLWPDFGLWQMLWAVFYYQRGYESLNKLREKVKVPIIEDHRVLTFLQTVKQF